MIGEGGESETVVPDSKAKLFAAGVLSGGDTTGRGVNVNMGGFVFNGSGGGGLNSSDVINDLVAKMKNETIEGVRFALAAANTASRNTSRAT
jgi:hypothetical protein